MKAEEVIGAFFDWEEKQPGVITNCEAFQAGVAYAATLRQQAGRVDEVTDEIVEHVQYSLDNHEDNRSYAEQVSARSVREALEAVWPTAAALAQNTQGDGEAVAEVCSMFELRWVGNGSISRIVDRHGIKVGDKLYLHAERARVPDEADDEFVPRWWDSSHGDAYKEGWNDCRIAAINLAAAPSQRAEVDAPERCESGSPGCGPVKYHDSEGVPLCAACWQSLLDDDDSQRAEVK